ncbi:MAG: L-threonylcarbamoyladenylate synthase [Pseudomonadota bacterium]
MSAVPSAFQLRLAAGVLLGGGVLACPTEAVFGLSCDPYDRAAVARLLALKQRPVEKGLIVVAAHVDQLGALLAPLSPAQRRQLASGWPGPNTWLVPNHGCFPVWITGGSRLVAVRVTAHPPLRALCEAFGGPLVSTSANPGGHPPARTALGVRLRFGGRIDGIVPGDTGGARNPTAIRDLETGRTVRPS